MSCGERSCKHKPCPIPDEGTMRNCNVDCRMYEWDGITKPDSISELIELKKIDEDSRVQSNVFDTRHIIDKKQAIKEMAVAVNPKHNCKHCYGTGFIGTNVDTKEKVRCECTRRKQ